MRRVLVDPSGTPIYPTPGMTFDVIHMQYRVSDDGNPEGDIVVVTVDRGVWTSMATLPITSVR